MPSRPGVVLDRLAGERLRHLARRLVGGEDERDVAAEDALQDRPDQRVVRAAEHDGVDLCLLQRRGGLAHRGDGRLAEGVVALDQRHELGAGDGDDGDAGIERPDQRLVAAAGDGRLGREQADATVARGAHGGVRLGLDHAEHRHRQRPLQVGQRRGGRRVAGSDDELDALALEVAGDLAREAADLVERPRAVRQAGAVAEVDEVLVRHRDQALVKDGEPTGTGVEHADRAGIHARECRRGLMCVRGASGAVLRQGARSTRRSSRLVALMIFSADAIRRAQGRIQMCS